MNIEITSFDPYRKNTLQNKTLGHRAMTKGLKKRIQ